MGIKDRFTCTQHNAWGLLPDALSHQKPARLSLPITHPTLFEKIPGGIFDLNETQTNHESWEHTNK